MANNQNFIVKHGLTVGGNQQVIDTSGNWTGPDTPYANASFARANSKTRTYTQDTAPTGVNANDIWIDSSNGVQYVYVTDVNSSQWVEFGPIGHPSGNISFTDQTITGLVTNRDVTIVQQGTGNIVLQSANTIITGNLFANASGKRAEFNDISAVYFRVNTATTVANSSAVNIVASTGYYTQPPTSNGYMLQLTGFDNLTSRVVNDSASVTGTAYSAFIGRHARGSHQSPSASQSGDMLARFSGNGYGTSGYGINSGGASVDIYATENYTDANRGTKLVISVTNPGTNVRVQTATFASNNITLTGNIIANTVSTHTSYFSNIKVDRNIFYNNQIDVANSIQYVDYANGAQILFPATQTTTLVHRNIVEGRNVFVIATNPSGTDQTINLGIPAQNCTATRDKNGKYLAPANTIDVYAGTTSSFQFMSFDGDTANIFCIITPT